MAKKPASPKRQAVILEDIKRALVELETLAPTLSKPAARATRTALVELRAGIDRAAGHLDEVKEPSAWFDPADPYTAGRLVAAALLAQPRVPLELVPRTYGAGVYAIYYVGDHPLYAAICGSETPIYVGKADPATGTAKTARDQGEKLYGRLADHRKVIRTVERWSAENPPAPPRHPLRIADFECRRLVTATNAQTYAESHLIGLFHPVWNKETNICWGISMHGDTEGRNNTRPPWHVLHPGVAWAMAEKRLDSRPLERIMADVLSHFETVPVFKDRDHIINEFLQAFAQDPMTSAAPVTDEEVAADGESAGEDSAE
jgi:hypothetical protein